MKFGTRCSSATFALACLFVLAGSPLGHAQSAPGACCYRTSDCIYTCVIVQDKSQCDSLGGTYFGDGTTCDRVTCTNPDCNGNGVEDWQEILNGTSPDCNHNCVPDECDIANGTSQDTNGNGIPDECEQGGACCYRTSDCIYVCVQVPDKSHCDALGGTYYGDGSGCAGVPCINPDCNGNGLEDWQDILNGTSQDCNHNCIPDECDIANGTSQDLNGNGIPDECEQGGACCYRTSDCIYVCVVVPDKSHCDALGGTYFGDGSICAGVPCVNPDCNGNGIEDWEDILGGVSQDCNHNCIPDECDIANGTSQDTNGNGIPDECEKGGACCYQTSDCIYVCVLVTDKKQCDSLGGTYFGDGSICAGVPCVNPDCNGNGIEDWEDILGGVSQDCNHNCIPDECDIANGTSQDLNGNGIPDECEQQGGACCYRTSDCIYVCLVVPDKSYCDALAGTYYGDGSDCALVACINPDCNGNGIEDWQDILNGFSKDCNLNCVPDECDIANGTSQDVNGNGIPDECEKGGACCYRTSDCIYVCVQVSGKRECDSLGGTYYGDGSSCLGVACINPDCNGNGIEDWEDILGGFSKDCNHNCIPDECDIANGTSQDTNGNGIPDECETGACCLPDGSCLEIFEAECKAIGGVFTFGVKCNEVKCGCPERDLDMTIATGMDANGDGRDDNWELISAPSGVPLGNALLSDANVAWLTMFGTQWISGFTNGGTGSHQVGDYTYETCFCLDPRFKDVFLSIDLRTDDTSKVYLNGNLIGSTGPYSFNTPNPTNIQVTNPALFRTDQPNCITIVVNNSGGPTGLNAVFLMAAHGGLCCDCNHNGISDSTDIADGTSQDLDGDGVPDECCNDQKDCNVTSFPVNTGYNHNTNSAYPLFVNDAYWTVLYDPDSSTTEPRPAGTIQKHPAWSNPEPNTQWISSYPTSSNYLNGSYVFEMCFCVEDLNQKIYLTCGGRADDAAWVYFNDTVSDILGNIATPLMPLDGYNSGTYTSNTFDITSKCVVGVNCIRVRLDNIGSVAAGFDLVGIVKGTRLIDPACCPDHGQITGCKWNDLDGDGVWDTGEPTIPGWIIHLSNGQTAVTDSTGCYYFNNLPPGTYTVWESPQAGWTQTYPSNPCNHTVTLCPNQSVPELNFGNRGCGCVNPPGNMTLWLPLDETSLTSPGYADNVVAGNNGLYHSFVAPWAAGVVNYGLHFDQGVVEVPSYPGINPAGGNFSIDAWTYQFDFWQTPRTIVHKRGKLGRGYWLYMKDYSGGVGPPNVELRLSDGVNTLVATGGTASTTAWHHIAVAVDRAAPSVTFYIDGAPTATTYTGTWPTGTLNNARPFLVGASDIGPRNNFWVGRMDEIEFFRRALTAAEVYSLYSSGIDQIPGDPCPAKGKCREFCSLPSNVPLCLNQNSAFATATICNYSGVAKTYNFQFSPLPTGPGCTIPGPTSFTPASGTITVPAGQCVPLTVIVGRPSGMNSALQIGCYELVLTEQNSCYGFSCHGSVQDRRDLCAVLIDIDDPVDVISDVARAIPFELTNTSDSQIEGTLRIRAIGPDMEPDLSVIRLNGLPPGEPVLGTLSLAPGDVLDEVLSVEYAEMDPLPFYTILIEADLDGDGEFEPLRSINVRQTLPSTVRFVDDDAELEGDGLSWNTAHRYLQDALPQPGTTSFVAEVRVAEGVYTPDRDEAGNVTPGDRKSSFVLRTGVEVTGGYRGIGSDDVEGEYNDRDPATFVSVASGDLSGDDGPNFTNYGENSYHVVTAGADADATAILDGFLIRSGNADGVGDPDFTDAGGGIRIGENGDPTILNCLLTKNRGRFGGGIENFRGKGTLLDCGIAGNTAFENDGGGASCNRSTSTFTRCEFADNTAAQLGGGLRTTSATVSLIECTFRNNRSASSGGGVSNVRSTATLESCVLSNNRSLGNGGAISNQVSGTVTIINGLIAGNSTTGIGGGVRNDGPTLTVINSTIIDNRASTGGGFALRTGSAAIANSVAYFNQDGGGTDESAQIDKGTGALALSYSDVQGLTGGFGGTGNIGGNPGLITNGAWNNNGTPGDPSDDFYVPGDPRLGGGSPCVDAADNSALPADTYDLDGDLDTSEKLPIDLYGGARRVDDVATTDTGNGSAPIVDMGAHERAIPAQTTGDMNCDGLTDFNDIDAFVSALIGQDQYESEYPECNWLNGDINGDGDTNFDDIDGFVECLINGGC